MITHFMQPHSPYFGERAKAIRQRVTDDHGITFWAWDEELCNSDVEKSDTFMPDLLSAAKEGYITVDELTEVYTENLELVLEYVDKLLDQVDGKTVVTSDHGEMLRSRLGHGRELYTEGLRKVPWVVLNTGHRREITSEKPVQQETAKLDMDKQLKALGYK
jgi:hypothetical protein